MKIFFTSTSRQGRFSLARGFWPPWLLIKVRLLYNRGAIFMTSSEHLAHFFITNVPFLEKVL